MNGKKLGGNVVDGEMGERKREREDERMRRETDSHTRMPKK